MKTIIAGSREYTNYITVCSVLDKCPWVITEVISGTARGPDTLGERWAEAADISTKQFPAAWDRHGKKAGFLRNKEMAEYGDAAVIFWDGESRGTKSMIDLALSHGLHVLVVNLPRVVKSAN